MLVHKKHGFFLLVRMRREGVREKEKHRNENKKFRRVFEHGNMI
jgi:hypothetical protein